MTFNDNFELAACNLALTQIDVFQISGVKSLYQSAFKVMLCKKSKLALLPRKHSIVS